MPVNTYIKHDTPRHQCPICFHTCHLRAPTRQPTTHTGRPPDRREALLTLLKQHTDWSNPISFETICMTLGYTEYALTQAIYRLRKQGWRIVLDTQFGYWLDPTSETIVLERLKKAYGVETRGLSENLSDTAPSRAKRR